MNKYLIRYEVFSIPNDIVNMGQTFEFTHKSNKNNLKEVKNEVISYLLNYFTRNNFNIEDIILRNK